MIRTFSAALMLATLSTCTMTPALAREQTFNDDEQRFFIGLCDIGEQAALLQTFRACQIIRAKIGQLPPAGVPVPPPPEPEKKPEQD